MHIFVRRPIFIGAIILAVSTLVMPLAVADEARWDRVASAPSRFAGMRNANEPIAFCTGDTQLNFSYQPGLESSSFETTSTTTAGSAYLQRPTEHEWATSISAADTGVVAGVLDLWGSPEVADYAPEAFSLALYELTQDARGLTETSNLSWQQQAKKILALARTLAGPHSADNIILDGDQLTGFVVRGQKGIPIVGVPFTAELEGAVFAESGLSTISGQTGTQPHQFPIEAPAFGAIKLSIVYTDIPGHSFRTGHHSVAQDMHLIGTRGTIQHAFDLRDAPEPVGVTIATRASIEESDDGIFVRDAISIEARDWPGVGDQPASYQLTAHLYGPFADELEQQSLVPDGLEPLDVRELTVTAPGDYHVDFDVELVEGWHTIVVSGEFDVSGEFAGLPAERIVMPFFEPAESVHLALSEPEPEPEPTPEPMPEPEPSSVPEPEPAPKEESGPEPTPESKPGPEPESETLTEPAFTPTPSIQQETSLPKTGGRSAGGIVMALGLIGLGGALVRGTREYA